MSNPTIHNADELEALALERGLLPFFACGILDSCRVKFIMQMEEQEARLVQEQPALTEEETWMITFADLERRFEALPKGCPALPPCGIFKRANRQIWGNIAIGLEEFCNIGKLMDFKRVLNVCRGVKSPCTSTKLSRTNTPASDACGM